MIGRRRALGAAGASLLLASATRAQDDPWHDRIGTYVGALSFYRSIPLEDIFPPPKNPHVDLDDRAPFGVQFAIQSIDGLGVIWLRLDGGPMQTSERGETLRFATLVDGVALLASAEGHPTPRSATLTARSDLVSTEALFSHADGSFWRRHFTVRFMPDRIEVIVWVFDAAGTRARTWRGAAVRWD
jgi:hypothetical protein